MAEALKSKEEGHVILPNASWGTYERLLREREERRYPRFYYHRGVLEIFSPSAEHDRISRLIAVLVELLAEEADTDVENAGSTTFKRRHNEPRREGDSELLTEDLQQGQEIEGQRVENPLPEAGEG